MRCRDGWGWLSPPYARLGRWAAKCAAVKQLGGRIALLAPAATGANWFCAHVVGQARACCCSTDAWRSCPISRRPVIQGLHPGVMRTEIAPGYEVWTWKPAASTRNPGRVRSVTANTVNA